MSHTQEMVFTLLQEIEAVEANQDDAHRRVQLVREFFFTGKSQDAPACG